MCFAVTFEGDAVFRRRRRRRRSPHRRRRRQIDSQIVKMSKAPSRQMSFTSPTAW